MVLELDEPVEIVTLLPPLREAVIALANMDEVAAAVNVLA